MFEYSHIDAILESAANKNQPPFILVLDGIEDPHNFGAILRSAEAAGVHGVIIRKARQVQVNDTVIKVSTGAANHILIARVPNIAEAISCLRKHDLVVFSLEIDGKELYNKVDLKGPVALVIGSEGFGTSRLVKERCDQIIRIPMQGKTSSLNASVATGIVLFEVLRQRG
jgi:23S rRNA (guanosine2251-2'-O)-methyltransferase